MIDTIKIYTQIDKNLYKRIKQQQTICQKFNESTGELFYKIVTDDLKGTYDSNIHVGVGSGMKYNFVNSYYLEIECSPHKVLLGHNAFNGFYDLRLIANKIINIVSAEYGLDLPKLNHWLLGRVDITKTFDLDTQDNVQKYINSLKLLSYPRRKISFYDTSLNCPGSYTTIKIYNKLVEFNKHDRSKLLRFTDFNIFEFESKIKGFVRFECEIKSKKLKNMYGKKYIRVMNVLYEDLEKIWNDEFMKILKFEDIKNNNIKKRVKTKEDIQERLNSRFKQSKANLLYSFFLTIVTDGYYITKGNFSESTFYRNIKLLKECGIDFSQSNFNDIATVDFDSMVDFDPFSFKEVI